MTDPQSLVCISGCGGSYDAFTPLFQCPQCGGLIDVVIDTAPLTRKRADAWRAQLSERAASVAPLDRSGVWAHREWVMPGIHDDEILTFGEGRAPLTDAHALARTHGIGRLLIKQCGQSPTGSFKDLGMTVLVSMASAMQKRGHHVRALVCASTGDTSAALAAYGALAEIPVVVLLPAGKISAAQLVQPIANGAHVLMLDGDFDRCMQVVEEVTRLPGMFLANSKNPLRLQGQMTVAFEIARELDWRAPDVVAVPSGNLGNVSALFMGFSLLARLGLIDKMPRLVACQVDAANPLYRAMPGRYETLEPLTARETHASAIRIGNPVSFPRARRALLASNGLVTSCGEPALLAAMAEADRGGQFTCPHTATALAGVAALARDGVIGSKDVVVVVSTATGLKFADQKALFHEGSTALGDLMLPASVAALRNPPVRLPADIADVQRALAPRLAGRGAS